MKRKNPSDNKITNGDLTDSSQKDIPLEKIKLKTNKIHDDCHDKVDITSHDYLSKYCAQECDFCGLKFQNRLSAIEHNVQHIIIPLVCLDLHHCTVCMLFFPSSKFLKDHMLSEHPEKIENINLQRKSIEDNSNCITSNTKPDDISERKYVRVKKEFQYWPENDTNSSDILDYESLLRPGFYRCKYCDKTFVNRYDNIIHHLEHMHISLIQPVPFFCESCEVFFEKHTEWLQHKFVKHKRKRNPVKMEKPKKLKHQCRYCPRQFVNVGTFMKHEEEHAILVPCGACSILVAINDMPLHSKVYHSSYHICNGCLLKLKETVQFKLVGLYSGSTRKCENCQYDYDNLKIVRNEGLIQEQKPAILPDYDESENVLGI